MQSNGDPSVYVVDDDSSVRKALRRLLRSAGHGVAAYPSAEDFRSSVSPSARGVLVLDLRMPGMNGFELQEWLRDQGSPLKVILVTAIAQPGDCERGLREGAIGFLVKPFDDKDLLTQVAGALA